MDVIFEIGTEALANLVGARLRRERLVFELQLPLGSETYVFHHLEPRGLSLRVAGHLPASWNQPVGGPVLDPLRFIPTQRIEGRLGVELRLVSLDRLRSRAPRDPLPATIPIFVTVVFAVQLQVGADVRLAVEVRDVDFPDFTPSDATDEQREAARRERDRARAQAVAELRRLTAGLRAAVDLRPLAGLLGSVPSVLNAGLAVDEPSGGGAATFLQVAIQIDRPEFRALGPLEAAGAAADTSAAWRAFYQRPVSLRRTSAWALFVADDLLTAGAVARTNATLANVGSRVGLRTAPTASWRGPAVHPPHGALVVTAPVTVFDICGTGHHLDATVRGTIVLSAPMADQLRLSIHFDYEPDAWQLFVCALEIGLLTGAAGFVIGGVLGGWVGAGIGALVGFAVGFIGVITFALLYAPELESLPPGCARGETARDVICEQTLTLGDRDFLRLSLNAVHAFPDGVALGGGVTVAARGLPARPEAIAWTELHWARLRSSPGWGLVAEIMVSNRGGEPLLFGPIVPVGRGVPLYSGRTSAPMAPLGPGSWTILRLEVPRADADAARAAGGLVAPELLVFTTAGSRVVRFTRVPEALSDDDIARAEHIEELARELKALERAGVDLARPFPPIPDPRRFAEQSSATLLQAIVRGLDPSRLGVADETGRLLTALDTAAERIETVTPGVRSETVFVVAAQDAGGSQSAKKLRELVATADNDRRKMIAGVKDALSDAVIERSFEGAVDHDEADQTTPEFQVAIGDSLAADVAAVDLERLGAMVKERVGEGPHPAVDVLMRSSALVPATRFEVPAGRAVGVSQHGSRRWLDVATGNAVLSVDADGLAVPVLAAVSLGDDGSPTPAQATSATAFGPAAITYGPYVVAPASPRGDTGEQGGSRVEFVVWAIADQRYG